MGEILGVVRTVSVETAETGSSHRKECFKNISEFTWRITIAKPCKCPVIKYGAC